MLNSSEGEKKLKESAKEFSDWIENGPYEGEEGENKEKDNKEKKVEDEDEEENKKDKKKR